jgi:threonine dehydratase
MAPFNSAVTETPSITEPSGALALAGLKHYILENNLIGAQKRFVAVVSGANMNFDRLRFVAERAELGEGREALLHAEHRSRTHYPDSALYRVFLGNAQL